MIMTMMMITKPSCIIIQHVLRRSGAATVSLSSRTIVGGSSYSLLTTSNTATDDNRLVRIQHHHRSFSSSSSPADVVHIAIDEARATTTAALRQIGWDNTDAAIQAEIMIAAELCGNNQGLVKLYQPNMMTPAPNAGKPVVERDTLSSAVINANKAPGMLAAVMATDLAIKKLNDDNDKNGNINISMVASYNTTTSSGQLAFYVERIAQHGYIGIGMCNSPELVAAAPGGKPVFGTNPLAVGIPQGPVGTPPFTFDMATSAIALFGVLTAQAQGHALPPQVAYGKDGNWTTDAHEALNGGGAIATFGGHKGAGLSLVVELLAGALSGSAVLGQVSSKKLAQSWGHLFIAIRPNALTDDFATKAASVIAAVKASGPNIRIPGERSTRTTQERLASGTIPIPIKIWDSIVNTAKNGLVV